MIEFTKQVQAGKVPKQPPIFPYRFDPATYKFQDQLRALGMWAIVDMQWTKPIAKWIGSRKCLEVMAGAGWLAKALSDHGVVIKATDNHSWHKLASIKRVSSVENIEAVRAIKKYPDSKILIVSWPPYNKPQAYKTIKAWGSDRPIIYIGEGEEGCTADKQFHNHFREDKRYTFGMPTFPGLHDHIYIGYYHNGS